MLLEKQSGTQFLGISSPCLLLLHSSRKRLYSSSRLGHPHPTLNDQKARGLLPILCLKLFLFGKKVFGFRRSLCFFGSSLSFISHFVIILRGFSSFILCVQWRCFHRRQRWFGIRTVIDFVPRRGRFGKKVGACLGFEFFCFLLIGRRLAWWTMIVYSLVS